MRTATCHLGEDIFTEWLSRNSDCDGLILIGSVTVDILKEISDAILNSHVSFIDISDFAIISEYENEWFECYLDSLDEDDNICMLSKMMMNRDFSTRFVWDGTMLLSDDLRTIVFHVPSKIVVIPPTVEIVGRYAFSGNNFLQKVVFKGDVKVVESYAFSDCYKLNIDLPESLEKLGEWAFSGCGLFNITIPKGLDTIPDGCFKGCVSVNIDSLSLVKYIGDSAFESCCYYDVWLPEGIESIGAYAFSGVKFVHLPSSIIDIDKDFYQDSEDKLQSIPYVDVAIDNPCFFDKKGTLYRIGEKHPYLGEGCEFVPRMPDKIVTIPDTFEHKYSVEEIYESFPKNNVWPLDSGKTMFCVYTGMNGYWNIIDRYKNEYLNKNSVQNIWFCYDKFVIVDGEVLSIDMKELLLSASMMEYVIEGCDNEGRIYVRTGEYEDEFYSELFTNDNPARCWCIDVNGNPLLKNKYEGLGRFDTDGFVPAKKWRLWGMIDEDEHEIIPFLYESVSNFDKEGMALVKKHGKQGYVNKNGELVIPFIYNFFYKEFGDDDYAYALIYRGKDAGGYFVDRKGKELGKLQPILCKEDVYMGGFHIFKHGDKYGYCRQFARDFSGCIYADIKRIDNNHLSVSLDGVNYKTVT